MRREKIKNKVIGYFEGNAINENGRRKQINTTIRHYVIIKQQKFLKLEESESIDEFVTCLITIFSKLKNVFPV